MARIDWRFAALGGAAIGVALSSLGGGADLGLTAPLLAIAAVLLVITRPAGRSGLALWMSLVGIVAAGAGLVEGSARLAAIDRGALRGGAGEGASVIGFVEGVPRRSHGTVRVRVRAPRGRVLVEAREPVGELPIGIEVRARGRLRPPPPDYAGYLRRFGIRLILEGSIEPTGRRRGGALGLVDAVRQRADRALGRSVPEREAALARGFVLGQDDRIDQATVDDFKRSGLAHLLAVSGENVLLLALLATPLLALAGLGLRSRLACILVLIALYVAVTGASPSIQRAGVMGAAGVVAALAGRPRSRAYALLLAAFVTLAANPRASGDPGWQLSFAAVLGIVLWAPQLRQLIERRLAPSSPGSVRSALIEGAAVTIAATLATAPLMAHDFEAVPAASLPANLMALPAVAPAMWLGMLASIAGQVPGLPVEPFNWLDSLLLAYIAQVAHWWAAPSWALVPLRLGSWPAVAGAYAMLALGLATASALVHRRVALTPGIPLRRGRRGAALALAACCCLALGLLIAGGAAGAGAPAPRTGLRLELLDVGQGDAILLQPADGLPILVDGGPHGDDLRGILAGQGVDRLAAAVVTHDQADHAGGIEDILGAVPVQTLVYGDPSPPLLRAASAAGIGAVHVAEGSEVRSGSLRVEVLWPPRGEPAVPGADPNLHAIVAVARWQGFSALLTADAEAESVPVDPGPVDVLKVAHHGSADAGLDGLLDRSGPRLALISVGAGNSYGHPTAETLAKLARHHVPVARTDLDGTVEIDVGDGGWTVKRSH